MPGTKFLLFDSWNSEVRMKYPDGWKKQSAWLSVKITFTEPTGACAVMISGKELPRKGMSLDEYVDEYAANVKREGGTPVKGTTTLAGLPARTISYSETQEGRPMKVLSVVTVKKDAAYVVGYVAKAGAYDSFLSVAKEMIASFQLKE